MNTKILITLFLFGLYITPASASKDYYDFKWELQQLEEKQRDPSHEDQQYIKEIVKIENDPLVLESTQKPNK